MTYGPGRTAHQATLDGDYFILVFRRGDDPRGVWDGESNCPGCRGLDEAIFAARGNFPRRRGRLVFAERVLPGSRIGCMMVEDAGTVTL